MGFVGEGTVTPTVGTHTYALGSSTVITASPSSGYSFSYWLFNNGSKVYLSQTTLKLTNSISVQAVFSAVGEPVASATPLPVVTPIPDGAIPYVNTQINEVAKVAGLSLSVIAGLGFVVGNTRFLGRRR
jgi:hypothetical protein